MINHKANDLRELEQIEQRKLQAHFQIVQRSLPQLRSEQRNHIPGQIVVLDSLGQNQTYLRSVPGMQPTDPADEKKAEQVWSLVRKITTDIWQAGESKRITAALIRKAVLKIRDEEAIRRLRLQGSFWALSQQSSHALKGSVFQNFIIPEIERKISNKKLKREELFVSTPKYIGDMEFSPTDASQAFAAIVGEVIATTTHLSDKSVTENKIASIRPTVVPFSALGAIRGVAVWFLFGEEELRQVRDKLKSRLRGLPDTLSTLFSNAVLDVFRTHFTQRLEQQVLSGEQVDVGKLAREPLRYLYPCLSMKTISQVEPEDDWRMQLLFKKESVRKFLGFNGIQWDLIHSKHLGNFYSWTMDEPVHVAYQNRIELEIEEIARNVANLKGVIFGQQLGVLGHQIGTIYKTSGMIGLLNDVKRDPSIPSSRVEQVLKGLLPVWGISQAITLARKIREDSSLEILKSWINPTFTSDQVSDLCNDVLAIVSYLYANVADEPFLPWFLIHSDGSEEPFVAGGGLTPLRIFKDDPLLMEKTFALAVGLIEMVTNLRKYPALTGVGAITRKIIAALPAEHRKVYIHCTHDTQRIRVTLDQPYVLAPGSTEPETPHSIREIQLMETQLSLSSATLPLVATSPLTRKKEKIRSQGNVIRCEQTWDFYWSNLWEKIKEKKVNSGTKTKSVND